MELEAFRDAVLGEDRRIVTIEDATHTVEVAEAMLRAADTGETQATRLSAGARIACRDVLARPDRLVRLGPPGRLACMQARVLRFRVLNLVACVVLTGFNAALEIWPMVAMNIVAVA